MITKRGMVLLLTAIVCYLAVLVLEIPAFLHVSAVILAVLLGCLVWTWIGWIGLAANLTLPQQAVVGEVITLRIDLYNRVPWPRWGIRVRAIFPPAGTEGTFLWSWVPGMRPFGETIVDLDAPCRTRGCFSIGQVSVFSGDPLGLFTREQSHLFKRNLEVLPACVELRGFPFIENGAGFRDPEKTMPTPGFSNDFYALRRYMAGDSPRWIHWLSTARRQKLMTRQFQAPVQRRVVIVLDCSRGNLLNVAGSEPFELAVSGAASIVRFAALTDHEVGMLAMGKEAQLIRPAAGLDNVRLMLSLLASLVQNGKRGRYDFSPAITCGAQSLVVVSSNPSAQFVQAIGSLRQDGLAISVVLAGRATPAAIKDLERQVDQLAAMGIPVCQTTTFDDLHEGLEKPVAMPSGAGNERAAVATYQRAY